MPGVGPQGPGGNRVSLAFRFPGFPLEGSFFARWFFVKTAPPEFLPANRELARPLLIVIIVRITPIRHR
jgi:hypothetical protein